MRNLLACFLLLLVQTAGATDVYVSTDRFGRKEFTDIEPESTHQQIEVEIQNDYDWHDPGKFSYTPARPPRQKIGNPPRRYTLDELKSKCHEARGRYNDFRGTDLDINWDTYRARLAKYKAKRDEWCSRLARGR